MCLYIIFLLFLLLRSRTPAQLSGGRLVIILLRQAAPTATLLFRAGTDRLRNSEEDRTRMDDCNRDRQQTPFQGRCVNQCKDRGAGTTQEQPVGGCEIIDDGEMLYDE